MKISKGIRRVRCYDVLKKAVCAVLVGGLVLVPGMQSVYGNGSCSQLSSNGSQNSNCHCSSTGPVVTGCGSGISVAAYDFCYGGLDQGYELCLNTSQTVGTRWDCASTVSWSKIADCSAKAAICAVACASSAAHAGILCGACITTYIATCTGCNYVSCVKVNVTTVKRMKVSVAAGVCPKSVNTGY